jgi:hypothetical protein
MMSSFTVNDTPRHSRFHRFTVTGTVEENHLTIGHSFPRGDRLGTEFLLSWRFLLVSWLFCLHSLVRPRPFWFVGDSVTVRANPLRIGSKPTHATNHLRLDSPWWNRRPLYPTKQTNQFIHHSFTVVRFLTLPIPTTIVAWDMTNASISTNTDLPQTTDERRPLPSTSVNESSSVETSKTTAVANQTPEESIRRSRDKPDMFAEPAQDLPFPTELQRARQSTPGAFPQGGTATRSTTLSTTTTDASQSTASVSPLYIAASGMPLLTATLVAEDEDDATGHSETTSGTHSTPRHNDDDDEEKQRGSVVLATAEPWEQHSVTEKTLRRTRRKRCTYALVVLLGIVGLVLGVTLGITNRTNSRTDSQTTAITANDGTTTGTPTAIVTV